MLVKILLVLLAGLLSIRAEKSSLRKRNLLQTTTFECILLEMATEFEDHSSQFEHICQGIGPDGDYSLMYSIDDNNGKVVDELGEQGLDVMHNSGRYKITMTDVIVDLEPVITTTPSTKVIIEDLGNQGIRRLGDVTGTRSIVIFRVTFNDASPTNSVTEIADAFFGPGSNNMKGRFAACSMNELIFNPGTGNGFGDIGVQELSVSTNGVGSNVHDIVNVITNAVKDQFGSSLRNTYDHVVYALPKGTTFNVGGSDRWLAFAYVKSYLSVYNDKNIMYISNQVHETGHNLGLMHSSHAGLAYGDQSGTMGYGYGQLNFPQMCFNAAKSWTLGWYAKKSREIDPRNKITLNLDAFVDYDSVPSNEYVLLKIDTKYVIYNKQKGINSETQEFQNQVTITEMARENDFSHAVDQLNPGQKYSFTYEGAPAIIEMCSTEYSGGIDKAKISIYMQSDGSGCSNPAGGQPQTPPAPAPIPITPAPTRSPTPDPTLRPTPAPTRSPTPYPTPNPTPNPTLSPTPGPTGQPTPRPTQRPPAPTRSPTPDPILPPTPAPTRFPSPYPTPNPTLSPTPGPTGQSTPGPTARPTEATALHPYEACGDGEMSVVITIKTDDKPEETSWYFKRRRGYPIGSGKDYTEKLKEFVYKYCVPDDQIYEFHLSDSGGDGIHSSEHGDGFYTIVVNGETYSEGGMFGSEEVDYILGDCPSESDKVLQFILATGTKPQDVSWKLTSVREGRVMTESKGGPWPGYSDRSISFIDHSCLAVNACYTLTVMSSNGWGLENGSFEINWDKKNVDYSIFAYGSSVEHTFGSCETSIETSEGRKFDMFEPVTAPEVEESIEVAN